MYIEEFYDLYSSPTAIRLIIPRKNEVGGACITCGERRGSYRVSVRKPEG